MEQFCGAGAASLGRRGENGRCDLSKSNLLHKLNIMKKNKFSVANRGSQIIAAGGD